MKNKHPGKCCTCGHPVGPGDGFTTKHGSQWLVWHATCELKVVPSRLTLDGITAEAKRILNNSKPTRKVNDDSHT